jgi:hypothetical protein
MDINDPQFSSQACYTNETGTSEVADDLILGNHKVLKGIEEISINYTSFGEVYDRTTTIANICFSTIIARNFLNDPNPKTMAQCKKHLDWNKWKEVIKAELNSLKKGKVFIDVIYMTPRIFSIGFKWVFVQKTNENNEVIRYKARLIMQGFT